MIRIKFSLLFIVASLYSAAQEKETAYHVSALQHVNAALYQLVHNPTNGLVYVAGPKAGFNRDVENFVYVLDGNTLAVVDSISVGKLLPFGIALNNKTQTLYVGHSLQQSITAIDLKTAKQHVIKSDREKAKIREIVVDENRNTVYVSDHGVPAIWIIDGSRNTITNYIECPGGYILGLNTDSKRGVIYATDGQDMKGHVLAFDADTHAPRGQYKTWSYCPLNIAVDHANNRLFVSQSNDNNITVLDGNTGEIIDKVYVGYDTSPIGLVYDEKSNTLYTATRNKQEVAIIDAASYTVTERVSTKGLPNTLSLDAATGTVYVTNKQAGRGGEQVENGDTVQKIQKR